MNPRSRIVRAVNADGKVLVCDTVREKPDDPRSRLEATHLLNPLQVLELANRSNSAEDFIWRINKAGSFNV